MIDKTQLKKIVAATPEGKAVGSETFWSQTIDSVLEPVLDKIATVYDFDFLMNEYSDVVTVVNQADYELTGANKDLRDVMNIRLGSDKDVLTKMRTLDADDYRSGGETFDGVQAWYQFKLNSQGYPIITLMDTPSSVETLYIRYRKKEISLKDFPDSFSHVIVDGVLGHLSDAKYRRFERSLKQMIKRYRTGGRDINLVGVDPHVTLGHSRRAALNRSG